MSKNVNQVLAAKLRRSWLDLTGASFKKKEEIVELDLWGISLKLFNSFRTKSL